MIVEAILLTIITASSTMELTAEEVLAFSAVSLSARMGKGRREREVAQHCLLSSAR